MPPKKKPGKNGYWQFFLELRDKSTNKHMSQQEMQDYANRKWVAMTREERAPYEQRAHTVRNHFSTATRYTSDGRDIEEIEETERKAAQKRQDMKNDIRTVLKTAHFNGTLIDHVFFIIHMNQLVYVPGEEKYYLCEVAISAFNLRDGLKDVFCMAIKPGKLPLGFYGSAKTISKESHQMLELVQEEPYDNNTQQVFREMIKFLKTHATGRDPYTVFAKEKNMEVVTNGMAKFCNDFDSAQDIQVQSLEYMFYVLKNTTAEREFWPNDSYSTDIVEKDVFCYTPDLSCDFHSVGDVSVSCSKSIVSRFAYTICDHCCGDLNINLVPGSHVPWGSKIDYGFGAGSQTTSNFDASDDRQVKLYSDENFPRYGTSESGASSVVSFSTLDGRKPKSVDGPSRAAARIEQSFRAVSISESRRDRGNLQLPKHGFSKH